MTSLSFAHPDFEEREIYLNAAFVSNISLMSLFMPYLCDTWGSIRIIVSSVRRQIARGDLSNLPVFCTLSSQSNLFRKSCGHFHPQGEERISLEKLQELSIYLISNLGSLFVHATMRTPAGSVQQGNIHSNIPDRACLALILPVPVFWLHSLLL